MLNEKNNIIVIYYSYTGNSKKVAEYVKEKLDADILELEPSVPFSINYDDVVTEWQNNDIKRDVMINPIKIDLNNYNKVILISCVWWYGISPVMKRFLKEYDLSNKDVIVAGCNAGWIGHSFNDYEILLEDSNVLGKLNLIFSSNETKRNQMVTSEDEINNWLSYIK